MWLKLYGTGDCETYRHVEDLVDVYFGWDDAAGDPTRVQIREWLLNLPLGVIHPFKDGCTVVRVTVVEE
jgi:hypothetical protein